MRQPKARWYRGCLLIPGHTARLTGMWWQWSAWVEGAGGFYADTLAGIKEMVREALAKQGKTREEL